MKPQLTPVTAPMQIRIADSIRLQIERGDLQPGDPIPTLQELADRWECHLGTVRVAMTLLRQQGLITSGRGKAPVVRPRPRRVVRSSKRHQAEKDLVLASEPERAKIGAAETDLNVPISQLEFSARYEVIPTDSELTKHFKISSDAQILNRTYQLIDPVTGRWQARSVSYIPVDLIAGNAALLDENNEPWPGGTMHQLSTVGIEVMEIIDEVVANMPSTAEQQLWGLEEGIPMFRVRRISFDKDGRVVEISDADYPADRTELSFVTPLAKW